jgi:glyoxylase-like metal-dependent hydrolase (beta-lactamase superfamily II)
MNTKRAAALAALALALAAMAPASAAPDAWLPYDKITPRAMWIDKIKEGLYVIRGPVRMDCMRGCRPGEKGDGVLHEAGDVAVRVTPEGVILVDAKFPEMVDDILALVRTVTDKPVKYLINSHYHNDHASGDSRLLAQGVTLLQQRWLRERYEVDKLEAGSATIAFGDYAAVHLGGVVVEAYNFAPGGHTRGDVISYFPDLKVVHMGDQVYAYVRKVEAMNERMKDAVRRGVPVDQVVPELGLESLGWPTRPARLPSSRGTCHRIMRRWRRC